MLFRLGLSAMLIGLVGASGRQEAVSVQELFRVGTVDRDSLTTFGHIVDVAADDEGNIYVLDNATDRITVFDSLGAPLTTYGRSGRGPGELLEPRALVSNGREIFALDVANTRISRVMLAGTELTLASEIALAPRGLAPGVDICVLGRRLFLLTAQQNRIQELDVDGGSVRSFGRPFADTALGLGFGEIECVGRGEGDGQVLAIGSQIGELHAYSAVGQHLWSIALPNFNPMKIYSEGSGVTVYSARDDGLPSDYVTTLTEIADGVVLVQYGSFPQGAGSPEEIVEVKSALISTANGHVLAFSKASPRLDVASEGRAFSHGADLFPRLIAYRLLSTN